MSLTDLFNRTRSARAAAAQKCKVPVPRLAQVFISGPGLVKVIDFDTQRTLAYCVTAQEAHALACRLERGELCA